MIKFFNKEVCDELKYYVYRLIDPRDDKTFYVGKGTGNRVFQHANLDASVLHDENHKVSPKETVIKEIINQGLEVKYIIHRHGMDEATAFHVESALIDAYYSAGLSNLVRGHYAELQGIATVDDLQKKYNLPLCELHSSHKLLLIKINKLSTRDPLDIYTLTHYCWALNKDRAQNAEYILALDRGVIIDAFIAIEWLPANKENFDYLPYADGTETHRWGFYGASAPKEIRELYIGQYGKRPTNINLKSQSPIRYFNC